MKAFNVTPSFDGEDALEKVDEEVFDLYIIDINIPHINGLELMKYIRQKDITTPIVIITASIELENFKTAFENGCSEYIKKPFYLEELEIRIDKLTNTSKNNTISIAQNIIFNETHNELHINNNIIKLRKKERRLLNILLKHKNHTLSYEIIEKFVWENEIRESYPLRQLVNDLRKKFNTGENFIFSETGIGYRFETHI
ncbi:MAG: response regulator transcription factor [Campylobacteraceae bacterium]|nr:response regulator transcription factor [Campylobacteraceae bacterium]